MTGRGSQPGRSRPVAGLCEPGALPYPRALRPRGFTLIELLITVSIIAIMASMILFALYGAGEAAKTAKTRAMIAKIDAIIKARWESYQTRRVPVKTPPDEWNDLNGDGICQVGDFIDLNRDGAPTTGEPGFNDMNLDGIAQGGEYTDYNMNGTPDPGEVLDSASPPGNGTPNPGEYTDYNNNGVPNVYPNRGYIRLYALRDLMRMELPDRWTDITDDPQTWSGYPIARPAVSQAYLRKYRALATPPSDFYQGAECLYLIVMAAVPDDADSRDVFKGAEIGDVDNDGAPELLDAWGVPIKFLRWAPGFQFSELQTAARLTGASGTGTVTVNGLGLSPTKGSYTGGALIEMSPTVASSLDGQPKVFNTTKMARIDQYTYVGPQATITTSSSASFSLDGVITNPDPFDPSRAHTSTATPSFALYPLVFSSGPNKCSGIFVSPGGFHVSDNVNRLNPFSTHPTSYMPPFPNNIMIGSAVNDVQEDNYVPNAWQDNIHNHLIGLK